MNLEKLMYFIKAAEYSNFTEAALDCHIAQSAMSRSIAEIEKELEVKFFTRFPNKVVLTPAGEVFLRDAKKIIESYNAAVSRARDTASGQSDSLNIGFGFFEHSLVLEYVRPFIEEHPSISISILQHSYDKLIQELKTGGCDIIFCSPIWADRVDDVMTVPLSPNETCLAFGKTHYLAGKESIRPEDIDGSVFVIPAYELSFEGFSHLCSSLGISPKKIITANTLESMISILETNVAVTFVPSYIIEDYKHKIEFRPIPTDNLRNKRHVAMCLNPINKPAIRLLMDDIIKRMDGVPGTDKR